MYICSGCHDLLVMSTYLDDIAILNRNDVDHIWIVNWIRKREAKTVIESL